MATTALGGAMDFLRDFGFFDIVLPFLLVFTIMFAILQKTEILGKDRRELDAMVAFVTGMLVAATNKVVTIISDALPNLIVLVIAILGFLILLGTFYKQGEFNFAKNDDNKWMMLTFSIIIFIAVLAIFLNSIKSESGVSWLSAILTYIFQNFSGTVVTSLIFLVVVIAVIFIVVRPSDNGNGGSGDDE